MKNTILAWIVEAKTQLTHDKRTKEAIQWMYEGKKRNWKYESK